MTIADRIEWIMTVRNHIRMRFEKEFEGPVIEEIVAAYVQAFLLDQMWDEK